MCLLKTFIDIVLFQGKVLFSLYHPLNRLLRRTLKNVKVGSLNIPAGTEFYAALADVHRDKEIWGPDADELNPSRSRFAEPPKQLGSYLAFGLGSRNCVGRNLTLVGTKIIVAMLIKKFSFVVSASYVHAPTMSLTLW